MTLSVVEEALGAGADPSEGIAASAAASEYVEILKRDKKPRNAQECRSMAQRLLVLMVVLKKTPQQVRCDLRRISENVRDAEHIASAEKKLAKSEAQIAEWEQLQRDNKLTDGTLRLLDGERATASRLRRRVRELRASIEEREQRLAREPEPEPASMVPGTRDY